MVDLPPWSQVRYPKAMYSFIGFVIAREPQLIHPIIQSHNPIFGHNTPNRRDNTLGQKWEMIVTTLFLNLLGRQAPEFFFIIGKIPRLRPSELRRAGTA